MWIELLVLAFAAGTLFYRWATKNNDFFEKRNLSYDKPTFLLGSGTDMIFGKKSVLDVLCELYNKHDDIVYGVYDGRKPVYLIRDPQLVKQIMIKDFDHFVNRINFMEVGEDDLFPNSLFFMQNEKWRDMRNTLSPAFTGKKMRQMFNLVVLEIEESMKYLQSQINNDPSLREKGMEIDVKDLTSRFTVDAIASTAFGLQVNSFKNRENEFFIKARKAANFTNVQQFKMMIINMFPKIAKFFKISLFDKDFSNYFMRLVLDAMKYRLEHNIHRPDMINLLMEAKGMLPTETPKTHFREWSDIEVVAQCFLFFLAGMEPTSVVLSFSIHELMENPEVQEKLVEEIQQFNEQMENDTLSYDILHNLNYMDKVVSEVLRKWPVTLVTDRVCSKDFVYETEKKTLLIEKGQLVRIAMCGIQRDPKYYPQPEVFNPERFSDEDKSNIESGTYFPFGLGPRSCIANRFAIMEVKAFLFYLLRDFRLEASPKTCRPLVLKTGFQVVPENGFWVQFVPRK